MEPGHKECRRTQLQSRMTGRAGIAHQTLDAISRLALAMTISSAAVVLFAADGYLGRKAILISATSM